MKGLRFLWFLPVYYRGVNHEQKRSWNPAFLLIDGEREAILVQQT